MKIDKFKIIALIYIFCFIYAQHGKYIRKSVSSLESVWFKPGSVSGLRFDSKTFDKFIDFYVEVDRFDYNILPSNLLQEFRREANSIEEVSTDAISEVLEGTVTSKIVEILNDPEVMQKRGDALKDESSFQSFAATKAKSLGLTVNELKTLMNSAYIYLPFISSATKESEGADDLSITIEGGIIWWQIVMDDDGTTSVDQVLSATTKGMSSIDPSATHPVTKQPLYNEFKFGPEKWSTTPVQYCQNDAMLAFCKNLGVKTKEIDDFKLTAQIVEADGSSYGFPLGFREGVHLDDGFHIVEYEEDAEGNEVAARKGFVRVSKTGDNNEDPNNYTYAKQLIGRRVTEGTVVMEHPRLGQDVRVKFSMISGMNISRPHSQLPNFLGGQYIFADGSDGATSAIGADIIFAYNLAPIIGISQTYLDIELGFFMPKAEIDLDAEAFPFIIPINFGATKKFQFGASNIGVGLIGGLDIFSMAGTINYFNIEYSYSYSIIAPGFGASLNYEMLLNSDLSFNVGVGYRLGLAPLMASITIDETEYDLTENYALYFDGKDFEKTFEDLNLGGLGIKVGINYALGELPINIFGFLDPFKKY
jgi:hypothetical protein